MDSGKLTRTLLAGLLGVAAIFIATTSLTAYSLHALFMARQQGSATRALLDSLDTFRQSIVDADIAEREFLISGDETDLAPYQLAHTSADEQLDQLQRLAESEPLPQTIVPKLRIATTAELTELARTISIRRNAGPSATHATVLSKADQHLLDAVRSLIEELGGDEREVLDGRRGTSNRNYQLAVRSCLLTGTLGLLGLLAFWLLARRQIRIQNGLAQVTQRQQEHLRVTLASIGDAVIATDSDGRVSFLNGIAETLTGWTAEHASGRPLEEVFQIVNEDTRLPVDSPARRALREGAIVGLANHTVLIAKDGVERLIEDSAAPIRDKDDRIVGVVLVFRDVTERRQAEKALHLANEEIRLALDAGRKTADQLELAQRAGGIGTFEWVVGNDYLTVSGVYCQIWGLEPRERVSVDELVARVHPDDRDRLGPSRIESDNPIEHAEFRITRADTDELRWIARRGQRIDTDQNGTRYAGVIYDITDRRQAEDDVRQREAQFRTLAQAMPNFVWTAGPDGYLDWCNDWVYRYSGRAIGTLDGTGWTTIVHPDDIQAAGERWGKAVSTGEIYETDFRLRRADGSYRWHLARALPVRGPGGEIQLWVGTNTDFEEQKAAAQDLEQLNETLERQVAERTADRDRIWRLSGDIMLIAHFDGIMTAVNPAWHTVLGWTPSELVGRNFFEFMHPDDLEPGVASAKILAEGSPLPRISDRFRHRDGSYRWISWSAVSGAGFINSVGRDITAEKEQAEALAETQEALRQSQKMEAVGQLTGGLAHDFNNLLAAISGSLELLSTRLVQGRLNEIERYVGSAQEAARRAAALTHRLLAFSRRQSLDPKPTDINRLIAGMDELIRRTMGPEIGIEVVGAGGLWHTLVDRNQLENALLNLCINARDAMPDGGHLTIETANKWLDERAARERDLPPGQYLSLCVTDTGTGMGPEVIAHAFDPFFTTKPLGMGTGLGLSMTYGFARQSGGQVRIYSELGQGTTMCIYLPRYHGSEAIEEEIPKEAGVHRPRSSATVLVVDDEPTVRLLVVEVLEDLGYNALEAADGPAGLKILQSNVSIDLLITDVGLPGGINGRQLADAARLLRPELKILFITGYAENAVVRNGHLERGMQLLTKPFGLDALTTRITSLLSEK